MSESITNPVLVRMRKAHENGRGVRLSWHELHAFSVELIGQWWESIDDDGVNSEATPSTDKEET